MSSSDVASVVLVSLPDVPVDFASLLDVSIGLV